MNTYCSIVTVAIAVDILIFCLDVWTIFVANAALYSTIVLLLLLLVQRPLSLFGARDTTNSAPHEH